MYMLKTHKHHFDLFKQIHGSKTLADYAKALQIPESEFISLDPAYFQHFEGTYYRKNKHIVDEIAQREALQVAQQPGFDPENNGNPHGKGVGEIKIVGTKRSESDERPDEDIEKGGKRVKTDEDEV
ncbi:hypothetical protein FGO68_gene9471 [Halteria grandinella]|uniref:Uncharacterized protein n=1 Tax=Halteria grandinella TaxID=5974 RepID=A0A8J8T9X0_HALGN|nr:hypothetical protein FGO68_gene9471 [Halteria grandinella]